MMKSLTFEHSLTRLEEVVQHLERGDLSLEEALASFEEGVKLATLCQQRLDAAEQRVEELIDAARSAPEGAADTPSRP